jgi:pyruvate kinase
MYRIPSSKLTRILFTLEEDALTYEDSILEEMITNGMDMVRIELITKHYKSFSALITKLYSVASSVNAVISIILEVPSNYRVALGSGDVNVEKGETILLVVGENSLPEVDFEYKETFRLNVVAADLSLGEKILFGDEINAEILNFSSEWILVKVLDTGTIYNKSRVKIQGNCKLTEGLSQKQLEDIQFACSQNIDFIAFSFSAFGFENEFSSISTQKGSSKVILRIEEYIETLKLEEIISKTDGVLVARYPMGTEMPIEKICTYQKEIVKKCNEQAKPVLISGHVLGSLRSLPYPLRADACDVYNGVIDGVDGFVLSSGVLGESAWRNTLEMLINILKTAEGEVDYHTFFKKTWVKSKPDVAESMASSAVKTAIELAAKYIVVVGETGKLPRLLAKYRPPIPIVFLTRDSKMAQQVLVNRGCVPVIHLFENYEDVKAWTVQNLQGTVVVLTESQGPHQILGILTGLS